MSNKQELVSICILYRQFILSYNVYRRFLLLGDFHLRKGVVWHEYIWDPIFDDCVWSTCCYDYRYKKIVTRLPKLWWLFFSCYSLEATHWSELPFLYLYYKPILVYLSIMISQCFSCIFLFIYIQSYWNAPEHIAVADEKDVR